MILQELFTGPTSSSASGTMLVKPDLIAYRPEEETIPDIEYPEKIKTISYRWSRKLDKLHTMMKVFNNSLRWTKPSNSVRFFLVICLILLSLLHDEYHIY